MVSHTNILPLMGYALEGDRYPVLVTEWMENGTVAEYVKKNYHVNVLSLVQHITICSCYYASLMISSFSTYRFEELLQVSGIYIPMALFTQI